MSADPLDLAAAEVLTRYPAALFAGAPAALGGHGGFSGARLWRLAGAAGTLCLRAWPPGQTADRLAFIHRLTARANAAGLAFVPRSFPTRDRAGWVEHAGRLWELQEWTPGTADYHRRPTPARLEAACDALGRLHLCWQAAGENAVGVCPAVLRRLRAFAEWRGLLRDGWRPPAGPALSHWMDAVPGLLRRWADREWQVHPCVGDPWHDNLLFDGDRLTGLVDYGAAKIDHPAADLARLLGSLVEDDAVGWAVGLRAYRRVRPFSAEEEAMARALDMTGTATAAALWLRWLYRGEGAVADRAAGERRLADLLRRVETMTAEPEA
jgi:Ser/Thr protein kinase RdoA (MazF antagonist)